MSGQVEVEGTVTLTVTAVDIIKHRFKDEPGYFEVRITAGRNGEGGEPEYATAYLPITSNFLPPNIQRDGVEKEADKTFATLAHFGVPSDGMELGKAEECLKKKKVQFYGKTNTKGHLNYYINTSKPEEAVDAAATAKQIAELYGKGASAPATKHGEIDPNDQLPMDDTDPFA
jgi:hypothetical protein